MSAGFGRLVLDGTVVPDPYVEGLDDAGSFEVVSDGGPRYRVDRGAEDALLGGPKWEVTRTDPGPEQVIGSVVGQKLFVRHGRLYPFWHAGATFPSGEESMLINAVFQVIGEAERTRHH